MHDSAYKFVQKMLTMLPSRKSVVEFGSRNVNGSVRQLFKDAEQYIGVDLREGPGVDVVANASLWHDNGRRFDTVVTTEMLEHAPDNGKIIANVLRLLKPRGVFLLTAATDPRHPHSAIEGGDLRPGEYYKNVNLEELCQSLSAFYFSLVDTSVTGDVYALAVK